MAYPLLETILSMPVFINSTHFMAILPEIFLTLATISLLIYNVFILLFYLLQCSYYYLILLVWVVVF